ncbi:hypothetical protein HUW46_09246 [Amycolatopsis sp. CA-230715]|nr:hypothetical protein HUW46_09246 [Amycolatopsis sp. CA-230715]
MHEEERGYVVTLSTQSYDVSGLRKMARNEAFEVAKFAEWRGFHPRVLNTAETAPNGNFPEESR